MMLKLAIGSLLAAATLGVGNASAATLAQVGTYDTKVLQDTLANSGSDTEEAWIEGFLGADVTYTQLANSGGANWEAVTDGVAGDFAFNFGGATPDYFLVKIGGGGGAGGDNTHFLYQNNPSDLWAFLNLSDFGAGVSLENIGVISHVGVTGGTTDVSEPGILGLFGVGLVLLGFLRRRAIA